MIVRQLTDSDIAEHNKTSSSAFIWGITDEDNSLPAPVMYGAFTDDGKTGMAQMECARFSVFFGGTKLGCAGIGGVAARPEFRGKGCMKAVFNKMEEETAANNFDISILYPFSTAFYRKLGYANLGHKCSLKAELSQFSAAKINTSVVLYQKENSGMLYDLYNSFAAKTDLMFFRDSDRYFYNKPYSDNRYTYILVSQGEYRAYASFFVNRSTSTLEVSEIGYLDREALLGILGFLRVYEGNMKYISFEKLPLDSPVLDIINDTSHIERSLQDLGSARIHNIDKVLRSRSYPQEYGRFSFFADDIFPANKGIYDVEYSGGKAEITRRQSGEYDISLDSCAMAKIFLSGTNESFEQLSFRPGIEIIKQNPYFLKAFPLNNVFFYDGF